MLGSSVYQRLAVLTAIWTLGLSGGSPGVEYSDRPNQDADALCHGAEVVDLEALQKNRAASVFTVLVTNGDHLEPKGTASLVDSDRGIFLTAAHVVHFARDFPIVVSQKARGQSRDYRVHIFPSPSVTDNWTKEDLALLQADHWTTSAQMLAFPFRIDSVDEYINGFFIGQAEDMSNSVFGEFGIAFGDPGPSDELTFKGTVFPHASGALLLDRRGRAFALVLHDAKLENGTGDRIKIDNLRRILWQKDHFSAFPLRGVLEKLKAIPATSPAQRLIDELINKGDNDEFRFGLARTTLTAIDTIHLTDTVVSADVWRGLLSGEHLSEILVGMMPVVQTACTHRYFAKQFARQFENQHAEAQSLLKRASATTSVETVKDSDTKSDIQTQAGGRSFDDQLKQFAKLPLDSARSAGMMFLREAEGAERGSSIAKAEAGLAVAMLRRAAEDPGVRKAIETATHNRDYAVLLANIALAEDISGNQDAARQAVVASHALGGSPRAYELAARFALDDRDQAAAVALYGRAWRMASAELGETSAESLDIKSKYDAVIAGLSYNGNAAGTPSANSVFDIAGHWYDSLTSEHSERTVKFLVDTSGVAKASAYPVYSKWVNAYKKDTGIGIDYQSLGGDAVFQPNESSDQRSAVATFRVSDRPLEKNELRNRDAIQFPLVMRAIVPVVNVAGIKPGDLVLDGPVLAKIFAGKIAAWNDETLKKLNPRINFPAERIEVVRRADDKSSVNLVFDDYLARSTKWWKFSVGIDRQAIQHTGIAIDGNEGVAERVASTEGAIGYVEYPFPKQRKLSYVKLVNAAGKVVEPTEFSITEAAINAAWANPPTFAGELTTSPGEFSWPIVAPTFVVMKKKPFDPAAAAEALHFFKWAYKNGDKAEEVVSLPSSVVNKVESIWSKEIKDAAERPIVLSPNE